MMAARRVSDTANVMEPLKQSLARHRVECLAHSGVPLSYWDVAFDTAIFLINGMPTHVLQGLSPHEKLFHLTPDYKILRSFGCACFPFIGPYTTGKLSFRTILRVFIGYGRNQKGYKCYDPAAQRIYMSRHVVFYETVFPLTMPNNSTPSHGATPSVSCSEQVF